MIWVHIKVGSKVLEKRDFVSKERAHMFIDDTVDKMETRGYECSREGSIVILTKVSDNPHEPIILKIILATT